MMKTINVLNKLSIVLLFAMSITNNSYGQIKSTSIDNKDKNGWPKLVINDLASHDLYIKFEEARKLLNEKKMKSGQQLGSLKLATNVLLTKKRKEFIINNPGSLYTAFLILNSESFNAKEKQTAYDRLTSDVKKSNYGVELKCDIAIMIQKDKIRLDKKATDFTLPTPEGLSLSLYEVVGKSKLTLLEFWASWCGPCRRETPNVKRIYDEYHTKGLNILSVSMDKDANSWKEAIANDKMTWYHVSELKFWDSEVAKLFEIKNVPQSFLLDANGRIIGENLQGEALRKKVAELLNKAD